MNAEKKESTSNGFFKKSHRKKELKNGEEKAYQVGKKAERGEEMKWRRSNKEETKKNYNERGKESVCICVRKHIKWVKKEREKTKEKGSLLGFFKKSIKMLKVSLYFSQQPRQNWYDSSVNRGKKWTEVRKHLLYMGFYNLKTDAYTRKGKQIQDSVWPYLEAENEKTFFLKLIYISDDELD